MPRKVLSEAVDNVLRLKENSEEWRRTVLAEATARSTLGHVLRLQVNHNHLCTKPSSLLVAQRK